MTRSPELPLLAAGVVALVGNVRRSGGFPENGLQSVVATVVLVLAASATGGTKAAPVVHAIGTLALLAAVFSTVRAYQK